MLPAAARSFWARTQLARRALQTRMSATCTAESNAMTSRAKAVVRMKPTDENVTISLTLAGKQRNLNRPLSEPLEKPLSRMRANIAPPPQKKPKKNKKKGAEEEPAPVQPAVPLQDIVVELYSSTTPDASSVIAPSTLNAEAWSQGRLLQVGDSLFDVELNPPTVEQVTLTKMAIQGLPLLPLASLAFAEEELTQWRWLRKQSGSNDWTEIGCSQPRYTPTQADVGCSLRCECIPASRQLRAGTSQAAGPDAGELWLGEAAAAETAPVRALGLATAADIRQPEPPGPPPHPAFRVLSYNILADQYASMTYSQDVLFNYCPKQFMDIEYRKQLVLQELERYGADVLCLQEVDEKVFFEFLLPHLRALGFDGRHTTKMGKVAEGSATFWRASRFRAVASHNIMLRDVFREPLAPLHAQFAPLLAASPALADALQKVTTVAQATLLLPTSSTGPEAPICVVNTHLFFHPYAPHIRTMHSAAILEEARSFLDAALADAALALPAAPAPTLIFCGDLNSDLNDGIPGVVELLRSGKLPADYWDWEQGAAFTWGKEQIQEGEEAPAPSTGNGPTSQPKQQQEDGTMSPSTAMHGQGADFVSAGDEPSSRIGVTGIDLEVPFRLRSADDLKTPYTNYTKGYKALLDYVWYEPGRLQVTRQLPQPSEEALATFIPSQAFPSDHLAVVYDFSWAAPSTPQ